MLAKALPALAVAGVQPLKLTPVIEPKALPLIVVEPVELVFEVGTVLAKMAFLMASVEINVCSFTDENDAGAVKVRAVPLLTLMLLATRTA
jgi:hypothetical protein